MNNQNYTKKVVLTGVLVAIAVVVGLLRTPLSDSMRVSFHAPFLYFIGYAVSPIFSAIGFFVSDILLFFIKPTSGNSFWPELTLIVTIKGLFFALAYNGILSFNKDKFRSLVLITTIIFFALTAGLFFLYGYDSLSVEVKDKLIKGAFVSFALFIVFLGVFIATKILKINEEYSKLIEFLKILIPMIIFTFLASAANTLVYIYRVTPNTSFLLLFFPKIFSSLFMSIYNSFVLYYFIKIYNKIILRNRKINNADEESEIGIVEETSEKVEEKIVDNDNKETIFESEEEVEEVEEVVVEEISKETSDENGINK